ncbi:MAG: mannose-1-phosphate guanyltransferase [Desulfuromonadales bacterium]|nr:mannose-1-phosphate guanyltransferase [Desulfuromonadales bacterium]
MIMAGGFGTRIHPLTINLPKPMIPLINRPILEHIVGLLKEHGITDLILLLYHQPEVIKKYFGDGSEFGVHITYVTPLEDFGTAGAVKAAARHLDERFLIISGDLLTDFNLSQAIACHEEKQAEATITLTSVTDPLQFGVVITDKQGRITKFLEKPGWGEVFSDTINTGIYILEPTVLDLIPPGENRDWSKDVFPKMLETGAALYGCSLDGYWADIGNPEAYLEACSDICHERVRVRIAEAASPAAPRIHLGRETVLAESARLDGTVVLGDNSRVAENVVLRDCVIGRNCQIEENVILEEAVLWDNVYVKAGSRVQGAVLGHQVRIGRNVQIEPQVVVADETLVGDDVQIRRDVKIWPRKVIESGSTVTANLIWGEKWRKSLFEGATVRGLTNVEMTPEFSARLGAAFGSTLPKGSYVLAGRDAVRSSRMLKRSFVGGLLSAGVNVRDVKMIPLPVLRYKLTSFGEVGGIHFRQSPEDPAATEILFFDGDGNEISSATTKGIERIYFKENFRRAHHSEPGGIEELPRLYDFYREGFLRQLDGDLLRKAAPRVVIDVNHSPAAELLPELLADLGFEVTELNSHVHEKGLDPSPEQRPAALNRLSRIVVSLEADAGFWLGPSGEKVQLIDRNGRVFSNREALGLLCNLVCQAKDGGSLALPIAAPQAIDELATRNGLTVERTRLDGRSLVEAARKRQVRLVASMDGRFGFPDFQANFDGLFMVAKIMELSCRTGLTLDQAFAQLPQHSYHHIQLPCSWECKGGLMRRMSEDAVDRNASFIDGVRIDTERGWVLVLPDQHRPLAHIFVESADAATADSLLASYRTKVTGWLDDIAGALER